MNLGCVRRLAGSDCIPCRALRIRKSGCRRMLPTMVTIGDKPQDTTLSKSRDALPSVYLSDLEDTILFLTHTCGVD